jgi:hypothetical protein
VRFKEKRAITWEEHLKIIDREPNREKELYYSLLWHSGGSQTDISSLTAEDVDFENGCVLAAGKRRRGLSFNLVLRAVRFSTAFQKRGNFSRI